MNQSKRAPKWADEGILIVLALAHQMGWPPSLDTSDPKVLKVSDLLNKANFHPESIRGPKFRNPDGVSRKYYDLRSNHPNYTGKPTNGGQATKRIIADYHEDPYRTLARAEAVLKSLDSGNPQIWPGTSLLSR